MPVQVFDQIDFLSALRTAFAKKQTTKQNKKINIYVKKKIKKIKHTITSSSAEYVRPRLPPCCCAASNKIT